MVKRGKGEREGKKGEGGARMEGRKEAGKGTRAAGAVRLEGRCGESQSE